MGNSLLWLAFLAALSAVFLFVRQYFGHDCRAARIAYNVYAVALVAATGYLLHALITGQFQFQYVYNQTNLSLAAVYRISALWAGQEGSYLFWALFGAIIGLILLRRGKKNPVLMAVYTGAQVFLLLFLLLDSPFKLMDYVPVDGAGLNPLLLDPWMVIHPPVVFIGYALLLVPMAFAVSTLVRRDFDSLERSLPWAVVGWFFLGAGIFIGGVWAYRVLGWGGYWSWDPVENSSLVPWLTGAALIHGLLVQKRTGRFVASNHFMAILTYVLIILAAYITRSGIMENFSVHAFATTPLTGALAAFLISCVLVGFGLWLYRFRDIKTRGGSLSPLTTSGSMALTEALLLAVAGLVLMGTLTPVITGLMGNAASVNQSFYLRTTGPVAVALLVLLGLCPALGGKPKKIALVLGELYLPVAGFGVIVAWAFALGIRSLGDLLFLGAAGFALVSNGGFFLKLLRRKGIKFSGGYLAHIGLALMLVGVMVSTNYSQASMVHLLLGQPEETLEHTFTWQQGLDILVEGKGGSALTHPRIYRDGDKTMREPGIVRNWWRDVYISPVELSTHYANQVMVNQGNYFSHGEYSLNFSQFKFSGHGQAGVVEVGAELVVRYLGEVKTVTPMLYMDGQQREFIGAELDQSQNVYLVAVDADNGVAAFTIGKEPPQEEELLIVEAKTVPFISVLALGTVILLLGSGLAVWRRFSSID